MAIAYASRGWHGIFIDEDGKAADDCPCPDSVLAEAQGVA